MNTPAVEISQLAKHYGATKAVNGLDLTVPAGQFFGFLGANGAGKTTTINCMTGISTLTAGTIKIFGVDNVRNYREARRLIGLSPQEFNVDIFAPTWKILDYMGGYYGIPGPERVARIEELLKRFELMPHKYKKFQELSGGLKRRVLLARALIHDPQLLILDEPTAGVDVELRRELWRYFRELNEEGKTIILTSHYLEEVEELCSRVAIIAKGKIVADQSMTDIKQAGERLEEMYLRVTKEAEAAEGGSRG